MVPLTSAVLTVLDGIERFEDVPWVIRNKSTGRLTSLFSHWQRIRKEACLDDMRVHDLRHSFASRKLALGETLSVIGKLLGHSDIETTARYAHMARDTLNVAAERIAVSVAADIL